MLLFEISMNTKFVLSLTEDEKNRKFPSISAHRAQNPFRHEPSNMDDISSELSEAMNVDII